MDKTLSVPVPTTENVLIGEELFTPTRRFWVSTDSTELPVAFWKLKVLTELVCGTNVAPGVDVPLKAKVVRPPGLVEADHWLSASYWTLSCGVELEVIVKAPLLIIPLAVMLPLLSTRNKLAPAALV